MCYKLVEFNLLWNYTFIAIINSKYYLEFIFLGTIRQQQQISIIPPHPQKKSNFISYRLEDSKLVMLSSFIFFNLKFGGPIQVIVIVKLTLENQHWRLFLQAHLLEFDSTTLNIKYILYVIYHKIINWNS